MRYDSIGFAGCCGPGMFTHFVPETSDLPDPSARHDDLL